MNGYLHKFLRKRSNLQKTTQKRNLPVDWERFRVARNKVKSEVRKAKRVYDIKLHDSINSECGSKSWWRVVKKYFFTQCKLKYSISSYLD